MSFYTVADTLTRKRKMKLLTSIWDFFVAFGEARYAANLARNGKWREAQAIYKD